jgi:hypothetical protein
MQSKHQALSARKSRRLACYLMMSSFKLQFHALLFWPVSVRCGWRRFGFGSFRRIKKADPPVVLHLRWLATGSGIIADHPSLSRVRWCLWSWWSTEKGGVSDQPSKRKKNNQVTRHFWADPSPTTKRCGGRCAGLVLVNVHNIDLGQRRKSQFPGKEG